MKVYRFKSYDLQLITRELIDVLVNEEDGVVKTSFSLGKDYTTIIKHGHIIKFNDVEINLSVINRIVKAGFVYALTKQGLLRLDFYRNGKYYKLLPVGAFTAPTLEISGIHMHRISGITPWEDAKKKIEVIGKLKGKLVLDICTGLGYTAINSLMYGAKSIISIEKDPNVLEIAKYNPWSKELANEKIKIILGDASEVILNFSNNQFDVIIHDPPRLALAEVLYSNAFYKELYRVLKPGGRLFHYVGKPGHLARKIKLIESVSGRLKRVGFKTKAVHDVLGILAIKPKR